MHRRSAGRRSAAGLVAESAFSISRTWRIAFRGRPRYEGYVPVTVLARIGRTARAVSTTRIFGFARRTGSPEELLHAEPFATKRSRSRSSSCRRG